MNALREFDLEPSEQTRALAFKRNSKLNIPIPLTSFIGREKELREITDLFSKSRLITLTGSGGVGKTRLAIQVVADILDRFADGIWFLDLAPLSDPALVPSTLANVLGLRESSELTTIDLLINYLGSRTVVIIFDNCEHLIDTCAQLVYSLLASCENLTILATSREALRISGEIPYRVPSLEVPARNVEYLSHVIANTASLRLFVERAATVSPGFAITPLNTLYIVQICQRLDGIPLAIELAAARVKVLSVDKISSRLDDCFRLLVGGSRTSLPRHQTLRAVIEWSYNILTEDERLLLCRLSVFAGGWTLEAAEEVCEGDNVVTCEILDLLNQLVDKSLVVVEGSQSGETRFRMLETIRQYTHEKLFSADRSNIIGRKHLAYFVKLAERAEPELFRSNQVFWLNRLDDEVDNFRVALEWALASDIESGL